MNGYFQFEVKEDGLYLNIHPSTGDGDPLNIEDLIHMMDKKNLPSFDLVPIKRAVEANEEKSFRVANKGIFSTDEWMEIKVTSDGMMAVAVFYPGFVGGGKVDKTEIMNDLGFIKVNTGINEELIDKLLVSKEYYKKYPIATGTKVVEGKDARIEYNFEVGKKALPKVKEDGTVDFYNLDSINKVAAGDVVARIIKEVEGTPGKDVYGHEIKPRKVAKKVFKHGRDLHVSEDGLELISDTNGHVDLYGDRISVSNTYDVPADVSYSTGNIDYDGNVLVRGNVLSGFSVKATGNIEVMGIVEGAVIEAGGDIVLQRGIQGMQQAVVKAGGNLIAKFIENAKLIEVGDKLDVGAIMHSTVNCQGEILVEGRNGLIIGGTTYALRQIEAKNIGNDMGTNTIISVGAPFALKVRAEEIKKRLASLSAEKDKLSQLILLLFKKNAESGADASKLELVKKTKDSIDAISKETAELEAEAEEIKLKMAESSNAIIKVNNTIYPGTRIVIGDSEMLIKDPIKYSNFKKVGADIKRLNSL